MMLAYVDTSVWIARMEGTIAYRSKIESRLEELGNTGWLFCASIPVTMEILYKPFRNKDRSLLSAYNDLFMNTPMLPNYSGLFSDSLHIVELESLKAMDAIHVALASYYDCDGFITTDADFRNLKTIPVIWIDLTSVS